jgi:hypothetical protein
MHFPISITLLALAATTPISAFGSWSRADSCPSVWKDVASELQSAFAGCNPEAHAAIRAPFHDCINNGCDGSLILSDECSRRENSGLVSICGKLKGWTDKYKVGAADMIQFAAATAISACPLGPRVQALVGRKDNSAAAAMGGVPSSRDSVSNILSAFAAKGFSADDVVALLGTHSVAQQFTDDPSQAGKPLDSTPGIYDTAFYKETKEGTAPYSLQSDRLMSNATETEATWSSFAESADKWAAAFVSAWNRFAVVGNDVGQLQDCSGLIADSSTSQRRMEFNAKFTERMSAKFRV